MSFNRINGFYFGDWSHSLEYEEMTLDERNDEVNAALQTRFEQLNAAIRQHESELKAMMVPVDTWIVYCHYPDDYRDPEPDGENQLLLGFIKLKGSWRLCHARHYEEYSGPPQDLSWISLTDASVSDRIDAVAHIEKLREAIVNKKEELVPQIEKAIETLASSLKTRGKK